MKRRQGAAEATTKTPPPHGRGTLRCLPWCHCERGVQPLDDSLQRVTLFFFVSLLTFSYAAFSPFLFRVPQHNTAELDLSSCALLPSLIHKHIYRHTYAQATTTSLLPHDDVGCLLQLLLCHAVRSSI
jgi:hypothetical protein